jgi:predicted esterase
VEEEANTDAIGFCSRSSSPMLEDDVNRRQLLKSPIIAAASLQQIISLKISHASEEDSVPILPRGQVFEVQDPNSYSAVVYIPPAPNNTAMKSKLSSLPLLVVLHGAGVNQHSALDEFTSSGGDHTNLPPYLLSTQQAPSSLSDNFVVVAPYVGKGKRSLYDEPRSKLLSFIKWFNSYVESQTLADGTHIAINRQKVSLFGFSEGATLAIELATTRQFLGVITASYGFTGSLPRMAIERLQGVPIWAYHSKGDDIYDIKCSDRLIGSLLEYEGGLDVFSVGDIIKYTKLVPLASNEKGREHVRASLVASKDAEVYSWLLSLN